MAEGGTLSGSLRAAGLHGKSGVGGGHTDGFGSFRMIWGLLACHGAGAGVGGRTA